jgi:hypothetical protein
MTLASALLAALAAAQPAPSPDGIALASPHPGPVREPSARGAWGGVRTGSEPTLSQRVADYRIEAVLDPVKHTVDGKEELTWRNRSARSVKSLYFHLYLNAFESPDSTFMTEKARYGRFRLEVETRKGEWGWIELVKVKQSGKELRWQYVHPDGGPDADHTVARVDLAEAVPPGGAARLEIEFFDQLPRVVARTGWFGNYHFVAQWYPKIGVLELPGERGATEPRWNCHEFHVFSEFYADFGAYDVTITAPKGYVVGAVGEEQGSPRETAQGLAHRFVQGDVHDFAFAADDHFKTLQGSYDGPGSPHVAVRVLYPAEYEESARISLEATIESLGYFSRTLGSYPYRTSTVVVPPHNAGESGGMEYETLFTTIGVPAHDVLQPFVRFVAVHEFGHGYFMGLLASNEFEEPFLDEGMNEYWDSRLMSREPVPVKHWGLSRLGFPSFALDWWDFERSGTTRFPADAIAGNSWDRFSRNSYGLVYSRTALVFHDLEEQIGTEAMEKGMREYYRRWHHRHPSAADLRAALEDATGQREIVSRWFESQVYAAQPVDDRLESIESTEVLPQPGTSVAEGKRIELDEKAVEKEIRQKRESFAKEHPGRKDREPGPFPWRTVVTARRYAAHLPQTLEVKFEDGSVETLQWAPGESWHRWIFEKPVRVESAQLDPKRRWLLDLTKLDDGRTREHHPLAASRWTLEGGAWIQVVLALVEAL